MESWRRVWREGLAPLMSEHGLAALGRALRNDDDRLIQGSTTIPLPYPRYEEHSVESACALSYCGWQGEGLETVGEVEEFFARVCFEIDNRLGEPNGCRWFLNWYDDAPREEMRRQLLAEVQRSLAQIHAEDEECAESEAA